MQIVSGKLKLADQNTKRFPYVVVEGSGPTRSLCSQHKTLENALTAAQQWKAPANTVVVDRRTGEVWGSAMVASYGR